jgi:hypothetical protein
MFQTQETYRHYMYLEGGARDPGNGRVGRGADKCDIDRDHDVGFGSTGEP